MVKVRYSEGVAIHTDPESCAGHCREAVREALTGGRTGEVLSGESNVVRGADAVVACRRQQARVRHREYLRSWRTKRSDPPRSRWRETMGPRGMRNCKARSGHRVGKL